MVKAAKILNPADKARKEARKKELKKNKKQRQQVRSAAIESRDPEQIIVELENLDKLEYDIDACSSNATLLKDKRKRLNESWARILTYYQREDPDKHASLKKLETEYEEKHKATIREFEAIKAAQEVKIEDIILPPEPDEEVDDIADDDPLMSEKIYVTPSVDGVKPPGCPPGLPPDFKQLVESLKSSLAAPVPQVLPQNLLNYAMQRNNHYRSRRAQPQQRQKDGFNDTRSSNQDKRQNSSSKVPINNTTKSPKKSAVIESKPVIFMPKATKFVPTSVRSRQVKKD